MTDPPPILSYDQGRPAKSGRRGWVKAILIGIVGGVLVGFSGYSVCFFGVAIGFLAGAVATMAMDGGRRRKYFGGTLGVAACVICALMVVSIIDWRAGFPPTPLAWLKKLALLGGLAGLPGICGSAMMAAVTQPKQ